MPRTKEGNQRIREAQRVKILEAARKVFARKGWAATMTDIAVEAKVSQGLAYRYFANKESIYLELVQRAIQSDSLQGRFEMTGTPTERLYTMLSKALNTRSEHIEFYQISVQILKDDTLPQELRDIVQSRAKAFRDTLKQLIVEGQETGEVVKDDPEQLVIAVLACINGLSSMALRENLRLKGHFPDVQIILRMLKR